MLQGLDPVLEGILSDLNKVTDFSTLLKLQDEHKSKLAEQDTKDDDEASSDESQPDSSAAKVVNKAAKSAVKAVGSFDDPKVAAKEVSKVKEDVSKE